jgi:YNFM family putative membrane transporter
MCFALIYVVQGILPDVSRDLGVSAAAASLMLSLTTLPLAFAVVVAASLSEGHGRRPFLLGALFGGSALTLLAAASPWFAVLLGIRVLTGIALAGLPAVAMAYLAEEIDPASLGTAMGFYISGTALGGMTGRLCGGLVAGLLSWRWALVVLGALGTVVALAVARVLPASRHFVAHRARPARRLLEVADPLRDRVIVLLACCGFVLMGSTVSVYNYLQYRLAAPPFGLSSAIVATVFVLYLFGTIGANWMGRLTAQRSWRSLLLLGLGIMGAGLALTLPSVLGLVLVGTAMLTFGFFGAHAVASGWVNAHSRHRRAQASAAYLLLYQIGSSVAGFAGGLLFGAHGWTGLACMVGGLLCTGIVLTLALPAVSPLRTSTSQPAR